MMEPHDSPSEVDLQAIISKAIYGFLIPQACGLSNKPIAPFILKAGTGCRNDIDVSTLQLTADTADATNICVSVTFNRAPGSQPTVSMFLG